MSAVTTTEQRVGVVEVRVEIWMNILGDLEDKVERIETFIGAHNLGEEEVMNEEALQQRIDVLHERNGALARECENLRLKIVRWEQDDLRENATHDPVKICRKYGVNGMGRVYNLQSGVEIPEDEPLILFRGKDRHLPDVLMEYADRCVDDAHGQSIMVKKREVELWQQNNQEQVKEPDTDLSSYELDPVGEAADGVLGQDRQRVTGPFGELRAAKTMSVADRLNRLEEFVGREHL